MALLQLLILAVVQGLTEFLPVSSSGHLVLLQNWFEPYKGDVWLDVVLHGGTLVAVVVVYRREIARLLRFDAPAVQYIVALVIGTVPAGLVGLALKHSVDRLFENAQAASAALFVTGLILLSTRATRSELRRTPGGWHPVAPPLLKSLWIGCAQAAAIMPGISRSGSTIAASLWSGLPRDEAARFSFLLAIPAILGAVVLHLKDGLATRAVGTIPLLLAALVSFLVGLVAVRLTALLVVQKHFWKFAFYCLPLGAVAFFLLGG